MDLPFDLGGIEGAGLAAMAGVLVVLALVDSTSFGTLLIPVWLLMSPGRPRPARLLAYLGTVAAFYLAVGIAVMLGAGAVLDRYGAALDSRPAMILQLLLGLGLFALSFRFDGKKAAARAEREGAKPGRLVRWRARAMGIEAGATPGAEAGVAVPGLLPTATAAPPQASLLPLLGLALGAVALEVGTMLPYLAAIGLLATSGLTTTASVGVLAAYCVVMVLPALLLLGGRLLARRVVEPLLARLERWLSKNAAELTGWALGGLGVLLTLNALGRLGWTG
ncbi:GAP family protein [Isoptericola sp. NPDC057653]|uniref:GAP family protein n=1 Tax=unclassified Isoptericola TaxID=2623355 RepID=UPI003683CF3E